MINITLLGTSCMVPTKERSTSAFYLEYNGEGILFDCGEGTQRQMNIANINRNKVKKVFIIVIFKYFNHFFCLRYLFYFYF